MSQSSIRLVKTPDVEKVISYLRSRYNLLSEAEIIKLALSEKYQKEKEMSTDTKQQIREGFYHAIEAGGQIGDKLIEKILAEKGLKRENMTEQEIYDLFLNTHKH